MTGDLILPYELVVLDDGSRAFVDENGEAVICARQKWDDGFGHIVKVDEITENGDVWVQHTGMFTGDGLHLLDVYWFDNWKLVPEEET